MKRVQNFSILGSENKLWIGRKIEICRVHLVLTSNQQLLQIHRTVFQAIQFGFIKLCKFKHECQIAQYPEGNQFKVNLS